MELGLDPPPTDVDYASWARTATRPFTDPPLGQASTVRRQRDARLSALMLGHERDRVRRSVVKSRWTGRLYDVTVP